ncbi:hypothetical protein BKI52_24400 [marine bacterium AO1-C]|nr:hypothetical protein BKI52_24400 [marine bacterium AO1-C]
MKHLLIILFCLLPLLSFAQPKSLNYTIDSKVFETKREIKVFLPGNFQPTDSLPVIYLFDAQWDQFYNLTSATIDYLIAIRQLPKCILVGIKSVKRQYELTPTPVNDDWKIPSLGGAKKLQNHLAQEVFPLIDSLYHPVSFRIAIGHSLGGTFILNSIVDAPELFNSYIAVSPNLQIDDEEIILKFQRNLNQIVKTKKYIFTTNGTEGNVDAMFLKYNQKLDTLLKKHSNTSFEWFFSSYQNLDHATIPLRSMYNGLIKLSKKWEIPPNTLSVFIANKRDFKNQVMQFYQKLAQWTGYVYTPELHTFYELARYCVSKKQYTDGLEMYNWAIKTYPKQVGLYKAKGECLEKLNKNKEAKKAYLQALKILPQQKELSKSDYQFYRNKINQNLKRLNQK